jgi:hypothetical protein
MTAVPLSAALPAACIVASGNGKMPPAFCRFSSAATDGFSAKEVIYF